MAGAGAATAAAGLASPDEARVSHEGSPVCRGAAFIREPLPAILAERQVSVCLLPTMRTYSYHADS